MSLDRKIAGKYIELSNDNLLTVENNLEGGYHLKYNYLKRKHTEQSMRGKPVSNFAPWPVYACLTSMMDHNIELK